MFGTRTGISASFGEAGINQIAWMGGNWDGHKGYRRDHRSGSGILMKNRWSLGDG